MLVIHTVTVAGSAQVQTTRSVASIIETATRLFVPVFEVPPLSQVTDAQQLLSLVASVQAPTRVHSQEGT